jgi:CarD family transcriptional regulator
VFALDQLVVYPAQGVGKIERIERHNIGADDADFYIVHILGNQATLMVPVATAAGVGLRPLCDSEKALTVLDSLKDPAAPGTVHIGQNWNRRHRGYAEKLNSGDLADVCNVLKELLCISGEKILSFGERRLMEQAMSLVTMELGYVLARDPLDIQRQVESFFGAVLQKTEKIR